MRKLGPGVYSKEGQIHISEAEICEHFGVPYTANNARTLEAAIKDVLKAQGVDVPIQAVGEMPAR